ncbi:hypothetical protein PR003_g24787 [Phytophthora rubi]|uniref:Secreted protein n=1 Tax=Phytophthora rubi TaxID=129364 RepID=A0A6A4CQ29_9STRA|nr:hypothetical protein PR002_g24083 [Phytophthora rubi]KAE8982537.1 hypothetical protein PR001_g23695 [Phytophthora rubi]KAE9292307.1 hypothetical protein PR003_g24787 [Phytophthora rubi]
MLSLILTSAAACPPPCAYAHYGCGVEAVDVGRARYRFSFVVDSSQRSRLRTRVLGTLLKHHVPARRAQVLRSKDT